MITKYFLYNNIACLSYYNNPFLLLLFPPLVSLFTPFLYMRKVGASVATGTHAWKKWVHKCQVLPMHEESGCMSAKCHSLISGIYIYG